MNVEIGTEAWQFPEKEYLNGVLLAVHLRTAEVSLTRGGVGPSTRSIQCSGGGVGGMWCK